ncbi:MAG: tRNA lysidine(34) synthetase TilS [Armatimonadota bacterium]|nr:tRNA lysidine(34) synthetase TilS [Armatimonadota bacterium]MDR7562729.1 tRNA lysidine(34) synthetase TilS [Armatimonadota bacterium]MDR7601028.1 tRNA lysidine(34) synthetase TilS [Armatimonadota bacterium]
MDRLVARIQRAVTECHLFPPGARILVACSGGADSTALLHILRRFPESWDLQLAVGHVHHGLRPEADEDANFVQRLCAELGVPFHLERLTGLRAQDPNLAARAREARYQALSRMAATVGASVVATGHTLDDQAETVLLRLVRGTGVAGLGGIPPRRPLRPGIEVVRPLLWTRREELRRFLSALGLSWREDPTNADLARQRNRIRHLVLPLLERENPRVREALAHLAEMVRAEEAWWEEQLETLREALVVRRAEDALRVDRLGLRELAPALQRRLLRALAEELGIGADATFVHVEQIRRAVLRGETGSEFALPGGVRARLAREVLILDRGSMQPPPAVEVPLPVPGEALSTELGLFVEARIEPVEGTGTARGEWEVELDPAVSERGLVLRNRRPGDRIRLRGGHRKVQDVLTEAGVPRWEREGVGIVATRDGEVLWVIGYCAAALPPSRGGRCLRMRAWRLEAGGGGSGCYNGAAGGGR